MLEKARMLKARMTRTNSIAYALVLFAADLFALINNFFAPSLINCSSRDLRLQPIVIVKTSGAAPLGKFILIKFERHPDDPVVLRIRQQAPGKVLHLERN